MIGFISVQRIEVVIFAIAIWRKRRRNSDLAGIHQFICFDTGVEAMKIVFIDQAVQDNQSAAALLRITLSRRIFFKISIAISKIPFVRNNSANTANRSTSPDHLGRQVRAK